MIYRGFKLVVEACILPNGDDGEIMATGGLGELATIVAELVQRVLSEDQAKILTAIGVDDGFHPSLDLKTLQFKGSAAAAEPATSVDILLHAADDGASNLDCAVMVPAFLVLLQSLILGRKPLEDVAVGGGFLNSQEVLLPFHSQDDLVTELELAAPFVKDTAIQSLLLPKGAELRNCDCTLDLEGNITKIGEANTKKRAKGSMKVVYPSSFSISDFLVKAFKRQE